LFTCIGRPGKSAASRSASEHAGTAYFSEKRWLGERLLVACLPRIFVIMLRGFPEKLKQTPRRIAVSSRRKLRNCGWRRRRLSWVT